MYFWIVVPTSEALVELPVLVTRLDGRGCSGCADIPGWCGSSFSLWEENLGDVEFQDRWKEQDIKVQSKVDGSRKEIKMIDTQSGHNEVILETRKKHHGLIALVTLMVSFNRFFNRFLSLRYILSCV